MKQSTVWFLFSAESCVAYLLVIYKQTFSVQVMSFGTGNVLHDVMISAIFLVAEWLRIFSRSRRTEGCLVGVI